LADRLPVLKRAPRSARVPTASSSAHCSRTATWARPGATSPSSATSCGNSSGSPRRPSSRPWSAARRRGVRTRAWERS